MNKHLLSGQSSAAVAQLGAGSSRFSMRGTAGTLVLLRLQSAVQLGSQSPKLYPEPVHSAPHGSTGASNKLFPAGTGQCASCSLQQTPTETPPL